MRLALDHHYSTLIATGLRDVGHDAVAAVERGWHLLDDDQLLDACSREKRSLLTNNVGDFAVLARHLAADGQAHHGLVFTSDHGFPRARHTIGQYVEALDQLMTHHSQVDALVDRILWLKPL